MPKRTQSLLGTILLLLVAVVPIGRGMIVTAQDEQSPTSIGDIDLAPMDSEHFALDWNVAASSGGGGGGTISSAHFRLSSTIGQPIIGNLNSAHFSQRANFWLKANYRVFLPIIIRN